MLLLAVSNLMFSDVLGMFHWNDCLAHILRWYQVDHPYDIGDVDIIITLIYMVTSKLRRIS